MRSNLIAIRMLLPAAGLMLMIPFLASTQERQMQGKTAGEAFKNIQVLKDIPAEQIGPTMREIARDLDVNCEFCHDEKDRSSDDKENKQTARNMIKMMQDINKTSFGGRMEVTCFTCHNGHNDPANTPNLPAFSVAVLGPGDEPKPPATPSVDEILANYVKALGGEQALRKVNSMVITGTRQGYTPAVDKVPPAVPVEHDWKAPDLSVVTTKTANGVAANGFDGTVAWTQDARGGVKQLDAKETARAKREADFYPALDLKQQYTRMAVRGTQQIGDRDAYVVVGIPDGDSAERYFFDTQTGLLLRRQTVQMTAVGNEPLAIDYDDYRDAGNGVKMPFVLHIVGPSRPDCATITVEKIQENAPIDNSKFAKPAAKAE